MFSNKTMKNVAALSFAFVFSTCCLGLLIGFILHMSDNDPCAVVISASLGIIFGMFVGLFVRAHDFTIFLPSSFNQSMIELEFTDDGETDEKVFELEDLEEATDKKKNVD